MIEGAPGRRSPWPNTQQPISTQTNALPWVPEKRSRAFGDDRSTPALFVLAPMKKDYHLEMLPKDWSPKNASVHETKCGRNKASRSAVNAPLPPCNLRLLRGRAPCNFVSSENELIGGSSKSHPSISNKVSESSLAFFGRSQTLTRTETRYQYRVRRYQEPHEQIGGHENHCYVCC